MCIYAFSWTVTDALKCAHPEDYLGPCTTKPGFEPDFFMYDAVMKKRWGLSCGVHWPKKEVCSPDWNERCPFNWVEKGGVCFAPRPVDEAGLEALRQEEEHDAQEAEYRDFALSHAPPETVFLQLKSKSKERSHFFFGEEETKPAELAWDDPLRVYPPTTANFTMDDVRSDVLYFRSAFATRMDLYDGQVAEIISSLQHIRRTLSSVSSVSVSRDEETNLQECSSGMNPQETGKPSSVSFRKSTRRGKRWSRLQWLQMLSFQGEGDGRNENGYVLPGAFPSSRPSSDLSATARPWYPYRLRPFHQAPDKARGFESNATADAQLRVPSTRLSHQVNHLHVSPPPNCNVTVHSEVLRNIPSSGQPVSAEQDSHPVVTVLTAGSHPVPTSPDEDFVFPPVFETVPVSTPVDRDSIVPRAAIPSLTSSSASSLTAEPTFASRNTSAVPATLQCWQCEDSSTGKRCSHWQCKVATYCSVAC
uniref:Uncharacterized protein n=1 Tax=Chromera velia CCMP2878 TaxID=1169474 RepID=A0A0G4IB87_9ALVE|eukprot:Cvel_12790.t1-p1 / transcript=Cvel_12790.t1 / gene=Cvel_12790 / organism=Chromera_velia_CCMP2878 / gene_product=hypothetical protein / transcript_product=hypothetical protein / location=Cvel_scaffold851:40693-46794(+) / protein_length=475 / sequence_SO=supercontig / SO=protein_coding / is_pseudo=false